MQKFEKGSALISALFIMTLVAIAATAMSLRLQLDIYRTRVTLISDKLYLATQAVSFWAISELSNPAQKYALSDQQGKILDFPPKLQTIYPGVKTTGSLYDLQSRFNINNVSDKKFQLAFINLLANTTKLNQQQRNNLTITLRDWLSPYQPGTNLSYYLKQKPPYYPAQLPMQHYSELRLLPGVNNQVYNALVDFITALPERTAINLNTAPKPVLKTLGYGLTDKQVNKLIAARGKKGIRDMKIIGPLLEKLNIRPEQITLESQYFMSVVTVSHDDINLTKYSIIKRSKDKKGKLSFSIISESFNTP